MNKSLKTSVALLTLSLALTAGVVSAAPATTSIKNNKMPQASASTAAKNFTIKINGSTLSDTGFQPSSAKEPLIPLRTVAAALGFTVTWNTDTRAVDLNKGNIFTTVKNGEDRYAINKMYTTLGTAPQTKGNQLYVPASFVSQVLHQTISVEGKQIVITPAVEHQNESGVITALRNDGKFQSVQIKGTGTAGIVLNVGKDTVIQMADGTKLAFTDLQLGMTVEAEHAMFATLSLPPQTPAYKITVQDSKKQGTTLATQGTVEEVIKAEDGSLSIRIKGTALSEQSPSEVVLRLAEDTALVNESGEAVEASTLVQGAKVIGFYSPLMTKSLPPIGTALKVVVETVQE
ncbi:MULTISPECIES: copper amine oxidase N-terminal domain-containing protein [unclassified Paenibacillus]|uniref:copper amine oxidase N-terminal domain-containing protein n=1 Tax=unclassified Paenibacillus TaxID=185978 RepID=UPI0030FB3EE4